MTQTLPLAALRAFEAAARLGSFTKAASELAMTQAAVSYQVKQLETRLDVALFRRAGRSVELTPIGRKLSASASEAFGLLRSACASAAEHHASRLLVTALPTVASNWLVPRLGDFQLTHSAYAVRLDSSTELVDLRASEFDVAIRTGNGHWPGCEAVRLFANDYSVVCSPDLAKGKRITVPSDLLKVPLFGREAWWQNWLRAAGVSIDTVKPTDLGTQTSEVKAALAQNGAAMVTPAFFADDIQTGRLVKPFAVTAASKSDYWLVYRAGSDRFANVRDFKRWMLRQVRQSGSTRSATSRS